MGWKKFLKIAVAIVAVVVTGPLAAAIAPAIAGVMGAGLAASVVSGAIAGAIVGGVGAAITGGDWKKGALMGAIGGGISGGLTDYTAGLDAAASAGPGDGLSNASPPPPPPSAGPGDGLVNAAPNPQNTPTGPYGEGIPQTPAGTPQSPNLVPEASKSLTGGPDAVSKTPSGGASKGMLDSALDKITSITEAHPWTKDVMKGAGEAVFKGIAESNTPTLAEQQMELDQFRQNMRSKSIMGLGKDPFAQNPYLASKYQKKPYVPFGQGMLKIPGTSGG